MSDHAVYAPSSAKRWTKCTASASAIQIAGISLDLSDGADEDGTEAHNEMERCLGALNGRTVAAGDFVALTKPVNPEHKAAFGVALAVDYTRHLVQGATGGSVLYIEQRVRLTDQIWGKPDITHWDIRERVLTIVDLKNGFVTVDAEGNEQTQIYAAGSIYTHNLPAKWIRHAIVQPNDFRPVPRVKQWMQSADALFTWASDTASIPMRALKFVAGEHCRYCPLFGQCEATRDVLTKLGIMLGHEAKHVRPDQVAPFMACKKPIEDWFKSLDKVQTKIALESTVAPGMKVVRSQPNRAWKDERAARDHIASKFGITALSAPTPSQAEKIGMSKDDVDKMATRPEGGPVLAFESDKRATFERKSAATMFADVLQGAAK